tara:strand:- start:183 stop:1283 length:1101 start_codon:yes stop_codon:yes gene_type:complete
MSDIRFNRWLHQSGTGGVYQISSGRVGIGSSAPTEILDVVGNIAASGDITAVNASFSGDVSIGGTLTYDDVTNIDSVGLITARGGVIVSSGSSIGIGTDDAKFTLDVRGETSFGEGMYKTNLDWATDTYQRVYSFSGASGGNVNSPADGAILVANPNTNPSNTRVGALIFGNSVVGTSNTSANPGLKAAIDCYTNSNISEPDDTGGRLNILTKPDGFPLRTSMTIDSEGRVTKPYQPLVSGVYVNGSTANISGSEMTPVFNGDVVNQGNHYHPTTGLFTCPVAGKYWISFQAHLQDQTGTYTTIRLKKNGTTISNAWKSDGSGGTLFAHAITSCSANDTLQIRVQTTDTTQYTNEKYWYGAIYLLA